MEKKKLLSIGGRLIFEAAVETTLSLVLAALARGADLRGANRRRDALPSPVSRPPPPDYPSSTSVSIPGQAGRL